MMILCSLLGVSLLAAVAHSAAPSERLPTLIERASADERYRLRRVSEPLSYKLYLDISDENFYSYRGSVDIEMRYLDTSNHFYLSSDGLVIDRDSIKVTKPNGDDLPLANLDTMDKYEMLIFYFNERLEQNAIYQVHIEFSNNIGTELKGLYRSSYTVGNATRYIATTHFESTYARSVFPCYDEPSYKAYFDVTIRHRSQYHALSNMPIKERVQDGEQHSITQFERSPFMSSYLLAFIVSDYKTLAEETDHIRVYAPENQVQHTIYAREFAQKSLQILEDLLGHEFQLPKVDLIAIPDFNMGAMENWGLITFRAVYLIYDDATTTARTKQNIANLITHEFVHSWFGNEVTPEWWTYLWLSEGFARYFEYYVTAQIEDEWHLWEQFVVNNVHSAFSQDDKAGNRPMSFYATEPDVLNGLFDYVVYAKSASVIRMFQNVIGFESFKAALNDYIESRSYMTTHPDYLYASIEKFSEVAMPGSVKTVFNNWADNAGYPVVTVTRNGKFVTCAQKRFWMPVEGETAPEDTKFYVPLNYATSAEADFNDTTAVDWLTPDIPEYTKELPADVDWILVNKQQTGFYRVNYDNNNWAALTEMLKSEKLYTIPVINRAQLIDDASNLAKAGELSYEIAFSLLEYLEMESEYIPWSTAYNALIHLNRMFSSNENYSRFEDFVRKITSRMYARISLTGTTSHISRLHRGNTIYLACYFGVTACVEDSQNLMQQMMSDESFVVPEEAQSAAFCSFSKHISSLNEDLMQMFFERYLSMKNNDNGLVSRFITGMGCTRNTTMIELYLALTTTNLPGFQLTGTERNQILVSVLSGSPEGLRASLKFMLEYYPDVSYMAGSVANIFTEFGNRINQKEQFETLQDIVAKYGGVFTESVYSAAGRALVQAEKNLAWVDQHSEAISNWLVSNDYTLSTTTVKPDKGGASSITAGFLLTLVTIIVALIN
ncbi:aminopeptidase N [Aedes aegypti]|uniref:Aminopeptidase n=1 Tax=Aedes aegypti TaxID=7159 RepID=A0A1S4FBL3_AEDAE|nr:aminopeptidase N [Aedes aegypti]